MTRAEVLERLEQLDHEGIGLTGKRRVSNRLEWSELCLALRDLDTRANLIPQIDPAPRAHYSLEDVGSAIEEAEGILRLLREDREAEHVAWTRYHRSYAELHRLKVAKEPALESISDAIGHAILSNNPRELAEAYYVEARIHFDQNGFRQAQESARNARSLLSKAELADETIGLDLDILQGRVFLRTQFYDSARVDLTNCLSHKTCDHDSLRKREVLYCMGHAYSGAGNFKEGLNCLEQAALVLDKDDRAYNQASDVALIPLTMKMAHVLARLHQFTESRGKYDECLAKIERLLVGSQQLQLRARVLHDKGALYLDYDDTPQDIIMAKQLFDDASATLNELSRDGIPAVDLETLIRANIGAIHMKEGRYEDAENAFREYVERFESLGRQADVCKGKRRLAQVLIAMQRFDEAATILQEALNLAEGIPVLDEKANISRTFSELFEAKEDYKSALDHFKQYHNQEAELRDERAKEAATLGTLRFDVDDQRRETLRLMRDVAQSDYHTNQHRLRTMFDKVDPEFNRKLYEALSQVPTREYQVLAFMRYYRRSQSQELAVLIDGDSRSDERIRRLQHEVRTRIRNEYMQRGEEIDFPTDGPALLRWVLNLGSVTRT